MEFLCFWFLVSRFLLLLAEVGVKKTNQKPETRNQKQAKESYSFAF